MCYVYVNMYIDALLMALLLHNKSSASSYKAHSLLLMSKPKAMTFSRPWSYRRKIMWGSIEIIMSDLKE